MLPLPGCPLEPPLLLLLPSPPLESKPLLLELLELKPLLLELLEVKPLLLELLELKSLFIGCICDTLYSGLFALHINICR